MIWLKLTTEDDEATWVNIDAFVEMKRLGDVTTLFAGSLAAWSHEDVVYFSIPVKETPEQILELMKASDEY